MTDFSDGIVGWLVANTKAVPPAPLTAPAKGQQGMFEATRAAVWYGMVWYGMVWYGMVYHTRNYVDRLVTTSFRPSIYIL